jgi:hypothetical protein
MSETLARLREIFSNVDEPLYRRIDAAEIVLDHEGPADVTDAAIAFLRSVKDEKYEVRALKILAKRTQAKAPKPNEVATGGFAERLEAARLRYLGRDQGHDH